MRAFICSIIVNLGLALTALAAPNYFDGKPTDTSFSPDKPVINGATYDDIRQGRGQTCCLMASLSAAARSGIDVGEHVKYLGDNQYSVRLFVKERWTHVVVSFNGWTKFDPQPNDKGEFWVALYQRAYLTAFDVDCSDDDPKMWACVKDGKRTDPLKDSQPWRQMGLALRTVTGRAVEVWELGNPASSINRIRDCLEKRQCVIVGTVAGPIESKVRLVSDHAYTVVKAGEDGIELRNPWGSEEIVRVEQPDMKYLDYAAVTK